MLWSIFRCVPHLWPTFICHSDNNCALRILLFYNQYAQLKSNNKLLYRMCVSRVSIQRDNSSIHMPFFVSFFSIQAHCNDFRCLSLSYFSVIFLFIRSIVFGIILLILIKTILIQLCAIIIVFIFIIIVTINTKSSQANKTIHFSSTIVVYSECFSILEYFFVSLTWNNKISSSSHKNITTQWNNMKRERKMYIKRTRKCIHFFCLYKFWLIDWKAKMCTVCYCIWIDKRWCDEGTTMKTLNKIEHL